MLICFVTAELYVVNFIDDATRKVHVYPFKRKDGNFPKHHYVASSSRDEEMSECRKLDK